MEEKELKDLLEQVQEASKKAANEAVKAEIVALQKQIEDLTNANKSEEIKEEVVRLAGELKAIQEKPQHDEKTGLSITAALKGKQEQLKEFLSKKSGKLEIEFKATHTSTDIDGRSSYFTWHENGRVGQIPVRRVFMRELFRNSTTGNEYIKYIDQETILRDAKNVALCGATTHNTKVTFKVYDLKVDKVRDFTHICYDMMEDYSFVESEIRNLLTSSLQLKIDNDLLLGTGVSPILNGVKKFASTMNVQNVNANYANSVQDAQLIDLISVAGAQIKAFGQNNSYMPNVVVLNPKDHQLLKLIKDGEGNYVKSNVVSPTLFQNQAGQLFIDGMLLIENPLVPANEFYIFDATKATVYSRPGVGVEFSFENRENFEQELVTAKVYERLNLLVRNVDANAFMHCAAIDTQLALLTKS
jgi:HK97 family phage major capsid protein